MIYTYKTHIPRCVPRLDVDQGKKQVGAPMFEPKIFLE